ncbi:hypothetical protein MA16_Dca006661 [Dendrobium catenatum]|uniref:Uncharacterized protein n=1 Tax=Dendrobium catenatum TaxID=906689 RepID=A0A2I0X5T3_9ASPA|nr:hypothetical protein MA16_Dca006661 [Dendrobium catenatum]
MGEVSFSDRSRFSACFKRKQKEGGIVRADLGSSRDDQSMAQHICFGAMSTKGGIRGQNPRDSNSVWEGRHKGPESIEILFWEREGSLGLGVQSLIRYRFTHIVRADLGSSWDDQFRCCSRFCTKVPGKFSCRYCPGRSGIVPGRSEHDTSQRANRPRN